MTSVSVRSGPGSVVDLRSGLTVEVGDTDQPVLLWALVIPGARVVAPFPDVGTAARYAADRGIDAGRCRVLPFVVADGIARL